MSDNQYLQDARKLLNHYFRINGEKAGDVMSDGQVEIFAFIYWKVHPRGAALAPTGYGKSEAIAMAVILRTALFQDDFIIGSVKYETSEVIMKKVIEHIFDHPDLIAELEIAGGERMSALKRERNKASVNFRKGGLIKIISLHGKDDDVGTAIGQHVPNIILDESPLLSPAKYLAILKILEGTGDYNKTFLFESGNAVNRNHFMQNIKTNDNYVAIDISLQQALDEGRLDARSVEEKRGLPFFEQFYECTFPAEDEIDEKGYRQLLTTEDIDAILVGMVDQTKEYKKLGGDIAGGGDYNAYCIRQNAIAWIESKNRSNDTMTNVNEVMRLVDNSEVVIDHGDHKEKRILLQKEEVFIDDIGIGRGVVDRLIELQYNVNGVSVGERAKEPDRYANKKAEYYWRVREWVRKHDADGNLVNKLQDFRINGISVWHELSWIRYKATTDKVVQIEPKAELKKRTGKSPDFAESFMLTFADRVGQANIRLL